MINPENLLDKETSEKVKSYNTTAEQLAFIAGVQFGLKTAKEIYNETHNG